MMNFIQNFHFLRPWLLLFLLLPILFFLKRKAIGKGNSSWEDICDKNLLDFLLINNNELKKISLRKFIYIGLITAAIAAAGPSWKKQEIPTFVVDNPNLFLLSLAHDMQLTDIVPSRLERAKFVMSDIMDGIPQGQFGVEVFSEEPYVITPITDDVGLIKNIMTQIKTDIVPDQGDRPDRAIKLALERFKSAGYTYGNIILFSSDVGQRFDLALEMAEKAVKNGYTVHVIDSSYGGNEKLKILANKGNGIYMRVIDPYLQKLIDKISNENTQRVKISQNLRSEYIDYGYYLLIIPLLCLLMFFRKGAFVFLLCCISWNAQADFFLNNNQTGHKLFMQQKYDDALKMFSDNLWRGISYYKLNNNEEALAEFSKSSDAVAIYNSGVILTKMCKYKEALQDFDNVIKIAPDNEDAIFNRKVLLELFEKAKDNPEVLSCNNQQQKQENNEKQDASNNQDNKQNDNENSDEKEQENQDKSSENNDSNSQNDEEKQQDKNDNRRQNQNDSSKNNDKNKTENMSDNENNNKSNKEKQSDEDSKNDSSENKSNPDDANSDEGEGLEKNNGDDKQEKSSDKQQKEDSAVNILKAKEGNSDDKYDEEALAMQRRYREIPDDVGGLLREFIKKEYLKDRYRDESN